MNNLTGFTAAGFACVSALALWKGTKERWIPTLLGVIVIGLTLKYALANDGWGWLIFMAGYAVLTAGAYGLKWYDKKHEPVVPPPPTTKPLWCHGSHGEGKDGHFIGPNEPYRFLYEDGTLTGAYLVKEDEKEKGKGDFAAGWALINSWHDRTPDATGNAGLMCLDCIQISRERSREYIEQIDKSNRLEFEWNAMSEADREARRMVAKGMGWCPKCLEQLKPKSSAGEDVRTCPECCEFPDHPNAPMHRVKRILEFVSLSESEWRLREAEAIARKENNLSKWATKGDDGLWRRKDNGLEVSA